MRITLIDGAGSGPASDRIVAALGIRASQTRLHRLEQELVAPCRGTFGCWTDHPGVCGTRDHAHAILADLLDCDVVAWVTRPRFGAWDPLTKGVLDRSLGLLAPVLETGPDGATRPKKRYDHYPRWAVFAIGGGRAEERKLFRRLVERTVANLDTAPWVRFFDDSAAVAGMDAAVGEALAVRGPAAPERAPANDWLHREGVPRTDGARHALVWVGSAKPARTSTSEALGRAFAERLVARGWTMEVLAGVPAAQHPERLIEAVQRADLVIPASPIYVDTLPGIVLEGLARLVDAPRERRAAWLPIVQCGLPEVAHTVLAVEALQHAVGERGDVWCGHLAMGQGGLLHGRPPADVGRPGVRLDAALDEAAAAIDAGQPVPSSVTAAFARPPLPDAVYRTASRAGWLWRALRSGAIGRLDAQPLLGGVERP